MKSFAKADHDSVIKSLQNTAQQKDFRQFAKQAGLLSTTE
jgi:NAD-dependent DNA ligase